MIVVSVCMSRKADWPASRSRLSPLSVSTPTKTRRLSRTRCSRNGWVWCLSRLTRGRWCTRGTVLMVCLTSIQLTAALTSQPRRPAPLDRRKHARLRARGHVHAQPRPLHRAGRDRPTQAVRERAHILGPHALAPRGQPDQKVQRQPPACGRGWRCGGQGQGQGARGRDGCGWR